MNWNAAFVLFCLMLFLRVMPVAAEEPSLATSIEETIAQVSTIKLACFEDTNRARNERLGTLFRAYVQERGGDVTAAVVQQFNRLVKQSGMTNFDDFLFAMTAPIRYVTDPASGSQVPVFGALGSDLINPWLAAAGVVEGAPWDQQPMYVSATLALREHLDFALIGVPDPNLSLELLPPELRPNAERAYRRLNPTNHFEGGYDHPLFYAVIREATRKFFREDYPRAKLTIADLVVPEAEGGFGIRSCLLCHERNHTAVYQRLLVQAYHHEARAKEPITASGSPKDPQSIRADQEAGAICRLAAQRVLACFPDQIDVEAARQSLSVLSARNLDRLKPGYNEFRDVLAGLGCLRCHRTGSDVPAEAYPATYGAYVLHDSDYYKNRNIERLCEVINFDNLEESELLHKAAAMVDHEGAKEVKLDANGVAVLRTALARWVGSSPVPTADLPDASSNSSPSSTTTRVQPNP